MDMFRWINKMYDRVQSDTAQQGEAWSQWVLLKWIYSNMPIYVQGDKTDNKGGIGRTWGRAAIDKYKIIASHWASYIKLNTKQFKWEDGGEFAESRSWETILEEIMRRMGLPNMSISNLYIQELEETPWEDGFDLQGFETWTVRYCTRYAELPTCMDANRVLEVYIKHMPVELYARLSQGTNSPTKNALMLLKNGVSITEALQPLRQEIKRILREEQLDFKSLERQRRRLAGDKKPMSARGGYVEEEESRSQGGENDEGYKQQFQELQEQIALMQEQQGRDRMYGRAQMERTPLKCIGCDGTGHTIDRCWRSTTSNDIPRSLKCAYALKKTISHMCIYGIVENMLTDTTTGLCAGLVDKWGVLMTPAMAMDLIRRIRRKLGQREGDERKKICTNHNCAYKNAPEPELVNYRQLRNDAPTACAVNDIVRQLLSEATNPQSTGERDENIATLDAYQRECWEEANERLEEEANDMEEEQ